MPYYVSSGITSDGIILENDSMTVLEGGTANNTKVNSGGWLELHSGGTVNSVTVNSSGGIWVDNGGTAIAIKENGGKVFVEENAKASFISNSFSGLMLSSAQATVHSGTTANSTTVKSGGWLYVYSSGTANSTTVDNLGYMFVSSGGTANSTTVNSGGWLFISSGGTANSTTVNSRGSIFIGEDGTANDMIINSRGLMSMDNNGIANNVTVNSGASVNLYAGTMNTVVINSDGMLRLYGGIANSTTVNSGGSIFIGEDGTANDTMLNSEGTLFVSFGGTANRTTVDSDSLLSVSSGGTATGIIENGGYVDVADGAEVTFASNSFSGLVLSQASATVHSATAAIDVTVDSGGRLSIFSGGAANDAIVNPGGEFEVVSGGTATGIIESGGYVDVADGAEVTFASNSFSGLVLSQASATVHSATAAIDVTVDSGGELYVFSGGTANSTTVNSDGRLHLFGGTANSTVVNCAGYLTVSSGGTANSTTVESDGGLYVFSGTANNVTVNSDGVLRLFGGTANSTVVNRAGYLTVSSGGTGNNTTINSGGSMVVYSGTANSTVVNRAGRFYVSSGGTINNTTVNSGGSMVVYSGTANGAAINSDGSVFICKDGTANDMIINSGGLISMDNNGGIANNVTVNSGGSMIVRSGGTVNSATINSDGELRLFGGTVNGATIHSSGRVHLSEGGMANDTTVNTGGSFVVGYDCTANGITVNSGCLEVYARGTANSATINSGGTLIIQYGGTVTGIMENGGYVNVTDGAEVTFASNLISGLVLSNASATIHSVTTATNAVVASSGTLYVCSGGKVYSTTLNSGGSLFVNSGGTAYRAKVGGSLFVDSGGTANRTTVISGGKLNVWSNGTANSTTIDFGGSLYVDSGGTANSITLNRGGNLQIAFGGTASVVFNPWFIDNKNNIASKADATVVFLERDANVYYGGRTGNITKADVFESLDIVNGKSAIVYSEGVISNATVSGGGNLVVSHGGIVSSVTVDSGGKITGYYDCASVSFASGAYLDFNVSYYDENSSDAFVRNLSLVRDDATISLTIGDLQKDGTYRLADGIDGFDRTITVLNPSIKIGSIMLDQTVKINGKDYTLSLNDGDLLLNIETDRFDTQYVYLDFEGKDNVLYRNADLDLSVSAEIIDPEFSEEQKQAILSRLSERFAGNGVVFTLDRPADVSYSTLYFGKSEAFQDYGEFFGISETNDCNNRNKGDNAFVLLNQSYSVEQIVSVASHMLDHLLGGSFFPDGSSELRDYAETSYLLSTKWSQSHPYWKFCPIISSNSLDVTPGSRSLTGCTNTAAAQIINYWIEKGLLDLTLQLEDSDAYTTKTGLPVYSSDDPPSGHLSFAETNKILANYKIGDEDSMAALCFAAGVVQKAIYFDVDDGGTTGTGWDKQLFYRSGLRETADCATGRFVPDPDREGRFIFENIDCIINNLLQGRPLGTTLLGIDHALVMDGYDSSTNTFHLNFGWNGGSDGWYTWEELDDYIFGGVMPGFSPVTTPDMSITGLRTDKEIVAGNEEFTLSFTVVNDGKEKMESITAFVYCGNKLLGGIEMSCVFPGSTRDLTCMIDPSALLDGDNLISVKLFQEESEELFSSVPLTVKYNSLLSVADGFFTGDFNGDLFETIAVEKDSAVTIYQNGEAWGLGVTLDPGWEVVGVGDFTGDNIDDFLRVNDEGYVVGEMSNGNGTFSPQVLNLKSAGWDILGTGDFNGNGTDDVLIANPTGASETVGLLGYWESGVTWTLINGYSAEWECVATGDYNGDGKCDMLWRNRFEGEGGGTYNAYCTWIVDDPVDWRMVSVANPAEWNFLCSGDFDGDGANDIAMINDVGVVGIWGVNDGYLSSWSILSAVTSEWQLAGVGDFDGNGTDDIAWHSAATGQVGAWMIEDKTLADWQVLANLA